MKALACKELFSQSEGKLNLSRALHCAMVDRGGRQQNIWTVVVSSLSIGYMILLYRSRYDIITSYVISYIFNIQCIIYTV